MSSPEAVLSDLRVAWGAGLGAHLPGLYLHGSLVAGDFAPDRSDLDLLAVLDRDPDRDLLAVLAGLHRDLDRRHPGWTGRIEVEYVSRDAVHDAARGRTDRAHVIARVSPGEALHLLPATVHRLVTWSTVHDQGRSLLGPPAAELLPAVDPDRVRAALLDHVRDWPDWVTGMTSPGGQSYAVLTLCRAFQRLRHGRQMSKRRAAERSAVDLPRWAGLVTWARDWWYEHGSDTDPGRPDEVVAFVREISAVVLAAERGTRPATGG
ncbi:aminoglycoside adenylyltransferase domain-containing protein [Micromonospora maritima]|uniref:aminoglycoside adenylyltransferase domain-containing protein n=1 Tax=Micromonospora maritima TaxID=986711 RepID=UPI00157BEBC2|nr:aminoglycoside adenylyltransferase domain-containing protein [Micromonospora maritima]